MLRIAVGLMLTAVSSAEARLRPLQVWTAPNGSTYQLAIEDDDVSGFGPEAMRPVVLEGKQLVAVGPWTYGALVHCAEPSRCGFLLSTWFPVKAELDYGAFRAPLEFADDDANYGLTYKPMSPSDWVAAIKGFADVYPVFFWSEVALGILGAALMALHKRKRQDQRGTKWRGIIEGTATVVWIVSLLVLLIATLFLLAFVGPSWFAFIAAYASFFAPYAIISLLIKGIGWLRARPAAASAAT